MPRTIETETSNPQAALELANMSFEDIQNKAFLKNKPSKVLLDFIEMNNIATSLTDGELQKIAGIVVDAYGVDKESRSTWESEMKDVWELISTDYSKVTNIRSDEANIRYPLILQACMHFNAQIMPQIIKGDKVVKGKSFLSNDINHENSDRLERVSSHMSYQLLHDITYWKRDTDKMMMMLPLLGTVFRKSYFNSITGKPEIDLCLPDRVIVNAGITDLNKAQRITHVIYVSSNELIENMRSGIFMEYPIEELGRSDTSGLDDERKKEETMQETVSYSQDKSENNTIYEGVHELYEQHRYLDLDGDGYQEPYIVTVHKSSQKVLRIVARYDESCFEFNEKGKTVKINAINYFTDYHFIPNPNGSFYSLGYGCLLYVLNETINSILNQLIYAGTLANRQCGFIAKGIRLPSGDFEFKAGEWKQVVSSGTNLAQNIVPLPIKEPSQTLFALLGTLVDSSKNITAISDIMTGQMPPANTPAATVMAMVEQSQQAYTAILARIYDSLQMEFEKLYNINRKYLKEEESFPLAQGIGMVTIQDYLVPSYGLYPVADPTLSSNLERIAQAQALLQLMEYPEIDRRKILANYLDVLKIRDVESYMPPPDPNAPPPPEALLKDAQRRNIEMNTACQLMSKEIDVSKLKIEEMKLQLDEIEVKSKTAYYGGRLATEKIGSVVKLTELEREATPAEIAKATQEEEAITQVTQLQDVSQQMFDRLAVLEQNASQMVGGLQQEATQVGMKEGVIPEQGAPQGGMPQEAMGAAEQPGAEQISPEGEV